MITLWYLQTIKFNTYDKWWHSDIYKQLSSTHNINHNTVIFIELVYALGELKGCKNPETRHTHLRSDGPR